MPQERVNRIENIITEDDTELEAVLPKGKGLMQGDSLQKQKSEQQEVLQMSQKAAQQFEHSEITKGDIVNMVDLLCNVQQDLQACFSTIRQQIRMGIG